MSFAQDGYLVFETGLPIDVLRGAIEDPRPYYGLDGRLMDFWKRSASVQRIATWPAILERLHELFGRRPLPFQTLNFSHGTTQPLHSDTIHFSSMPPGWMCGVWVALEDIHPDSGPLMVVPGSHTLPEFTLQDAGVAERPGGDHQEFHRRHYPAYEEFIARQVRARGLAQRELLLRQGQAVIWAANLLHGGAEWNDRTRSRFSQATHYFFEGVQPYTPMFSGPAEPFRREPEWIPAPVA